MSDKENDKAIEEVLLLLHQKTKDIIAKLTELEKNDTIETEERKEEQFETKSNLLKLVRFVELVHDNEKKDRQENDKKNRDEAKKQAQKLQDLISDYAKDLYSYKGIKDILDNKQNLQIANLKAELARERASVLNELVKKENEIAVNKADADEEKILIRAKMSEENSLLRSKLVEANSKLEQVKTANEQSNKKMKEQITKMEERIIELGKIVDVLQVGTTNTAAGSD